MSQKKIPTFFTFETGASSLNKNLKNLRNIFAWLLLLIHLLNGWAMHLAPRKTDRLVLQKICIREETRAQLLTPARPPATRNLQWAAPETGKTSEPKPVVKLCPVKLAPPPASLSAPAFSEFLPLELAPFQPVTYHFLSVSEEPDPPRFA